MASPLLRLVIDVKRRMIENLENSRTRSKDVYESDSNKEKG
jgi:hypothetical protein